MSIKLEEQDLSKLSPMMQHYLQTKREYPGCILFYRLGDFYDMFFEDAEIVLEKTKPMGWKAAATGTEFQRRLAEVLKSHALGVSLEQLRTILPEYPYNSIWIQLNRWKAAGKITKEGHIYRVKRKDN